MSEHAQVLAQEQSERRRQAGIAVISLRRAWLTQQLQTGGVSFRHVVPQLHTQLVPAVRPPLLLDTANMPQALVTGLLWEVARRRSPLPTVVLIPATHIGIARLAALPQAVTAVIADSAPLDVLTSWLRLAPQFAVRHPETSPAWVAMPPLEHTAQLPPFTLDVLAALAPYGSEPPASVTAAAEIAGVSRRLFCYQLAALRAICGVAPERRYRPTALATILYTALTANSSQPVVCAEWQRSHIHASTKVCT